MRLDGPESGNIEDRRGQRGGPRGRRGGGIAVGGLGGVAILLLCLFLGVDPSLILDDGSAPSPGIQQTQRQAPASAEADRRFVAQVLGETEQVWRAQFDQLGRQYREPTLVLYSGATQSGCGYSQAQVGPFYCPNDQKVYIDLDFMAMLQQRLGARGDFASAYIIAHEVGHHVQNQLGILRLAERIEHTPGGPDANAMQVRIELQADCFAGLWARQAHDARRILEDGDIEEGIGAAAAVGDDRLQQQAGQRVRPESFTHGSSAERVKWFRTGLERGEMAACNTFAGLPTVTQ
ncbi:KPN_02809 family neutral zinc metallopeptidase [Roseomonas marmotae]|uniref:Neutral zinc metallopeptidase n=1 Tax=Roseomonas marmotae TaxID=2768161 RepID=A0ABS3K7Y9_9PROT|nr:neutral zinc metallopeptidase [Roseomonas marmotae]MBO1073591.1 neutral zinc metallopeptidase [Roseomonas marmotae]QTI80228.1 neutral zinc metallopeptidase [Roseomonas marmotae]